MKAAYRKARVGDAALLVHIYDLSFYADYLKYGECPGYGRSKAEMEKSILRYPKHIQSVSNAFRIASQATGATATTMWSFAVPSKIRRPPTEGFRCSPAYR